MEFTPAKSNVFERKCFKEHPAAALFPLMDGEQYETLKADIAANGLREPVVLYTDGTVLDGRNRLRACDELGIAAECRYWRGDDPVAFVISLNLARRHLAENQRAMVAARAKAMFEEAARKRMLAGKAADPTANLREGSGEVRQDRTAAAQAARALNVSPRSVESAAQVLKHGTPEVVARVDKGELAVSVAAQAAKLPVEKQAELASVPAKELRAKIHAVEEEVSEAARQEAALPFVTGEWKHYQVAEAKDVLEKLPEIEQPRISQAVSNLGYLHPKDAIKILGNLAGKRPSERSEFYQLATSGDKAKVSLACTKAANHPPMPDPRIVAMVGIESQIRAAIKLRNDDVTEMLESLLEDAQAISTALKGRKIA